jgi:hypothetical protein
MSRFSVSSFSVCQCVCECVRVDSLFLVSQCMCQCVCECVRVDSLFLVSIFLTPTNNKEINSIVYSCISAGCHDQY